MRTVFLKDARRGKFPQLVSDHILCHEDGDKSFAIVHIEGVSDKVRSHSAAARPGFDWFLDAGVVHPVDFIEDLPLDEWAFF